MKAAYKAEYIGHGYATTYTSLAAAIPTPLRAQVAADVGFDLNRQGQATDKLNPRPWVAEITGTHPTYRYQRQFLKPKVDYGDASSTGNRGIWHFWTLESGRLYETSRRTSWTSGVTREFVTVTDGGEITTLTREEVDQWLNDHSASTS